MYKVNEKYVINTYYYDKPKLITQEAVDELLKTERPYDLSNKVFNNINFDCADLTEADMKYSEFNNCNFIGANLTYCFTCVSSFYDCDFSYAKMRGYYCNVTICNSKFLHSNLSKTVFRKATLEKCDFSFAFMRGAELEKSFCDDLIIDNAVECDFDPAMDYDG